MVWVANRDCPVSDPFSSELKLLWDGNLVILASSKHQIWSTGSTSLMPNSTSGVLLDNGNFILRKTSDVSSVAWQSFDHPTDTWLPGAKFVFYSHTSERTVLVAWRDLDDPAPGIFSAIPGAEERFQLSLFNGSEAYWNSSDWNEDDFGHQPSLTVENTINFTFFSNESETYSKYSTVAPYNLSRIVLESTGLFKHLVWAKHIQEWKVLYALPAQTYFKDFYVRIAALDWTEESKKKGKPSLSFISAVVVSLAFLVVLSVWLVTIRTRRSARAVDDQLLHFEYRVLKKATKNFSEKIGEGGFSSVFRGALPDSTPIAVKKLVDQNQSNKQFLAELLGRDVSRVITTMRGTRGYLAPEWILGGAITSKVDVFSYGKLLFEIISGKRNIEELNSDMREYLPLQVANSIAKGEEVLPLVDRRLNGLVEMEGLCRACKVACWCIQDSERDRPTMTQVVQILVGAMAVEKPPIPRTFLQLVGINESEA
ncbi:hypothetical protein NL676_000979 [Syzygium grande]|nr:hypothetical protein NL676_000979 [Syzygium grande]